MATAIETLSTVAAGNVGLVVQGVSSQSADLQEWQDTSGATLMSVGAAGAFTGALDSLTNVTLPVTLTVSKGTVHKVTVSSAGMDSTINANAAGNAAQEMTVLVLNSTGSSLTFNFGTNFRQSAAVTSLPNNKAAVVRFVSDGSAWFEVCRTVGV
jgi:hypothetical protein